MIDQMVTIDEVADIYDGPHATPRKTNSGPYFLSISSLENGRLDLSKSAFLSEDDYTKWTRRVTPQKGDLLFSYETRLGEAALMPDNLRACLGRRMGLLRPKSDKVIPEYLLYAYLSPDFQRKIVGRTIRGATVDRIALNDLPKFKIRIPDLEEQRQVTGLLKALDSRIELNNRINVELEALTKAIYNFWFVQFDFPNRQGKPYKSSGGKMIYNPELKRSVPADWSNGKLSDIAHITMGQSPPGSSYNESGVGIIFFQGCTDFGERFPVIRQYTTKPTRFASKGDILLSVRAPVGELNLAGENCCIGRGLSALRSKDNSPSYLIKVMQNFKQIFERRNGEGTTFGAITKDDLYSLKVIRPSPDILAMYDKVVSPMFEQQNIVAAENQLLAEARDWLLPMLMNGQVMVNTKVPAI